MTPTPLNEMTLKILATKQNQKKLCACYQTRDESLPMTPNPNAVHCAALYITIWSICWDDATLSATVLKTTVETVTPTDVPTCVIVMKSAPATLCSFGRANLAINSVPAEEAMSAPIAPSEIAGKANAQYVSLGWITAKRRQAIVVATVPMLIIQEMAIRAAINPTQRLHRIPEKNIGKRRTAVCNGV